MTSWNERDKAMKRAVKLARSGQYTGWWAIQHQLRAEGFPGAVQLMDEAGTREWLDRLCNYARKGIEN